MWQGACNDGNIKMGNRVRAGESESYLELEGESELADQIEALCMHCSLAAGPWLAAVLGTVTQCRRLPCLHLDDRCKWASSARTDWSQRESG